MSFDYNGSMIVSKVLPGAAKLVAEAAGGVLQSMGKAEKSNYVIEKSIGYLLTHLFYLSLITW
jgi:arginine repressor